MEIQNKKKKGFGAGVITLIITFGTKLLKMTKVIKAALIIGSIASYSYLFNWKFALMIVATILFHEYGHFWAMKKCGIKTKGIYMIPFVGGAAIADEKFKSRRDEAYIALMGPWFGLGMSLAIGSLYYVTGNPLFAVGGAWMAMINLFNLLPINPLDGGRIIKSMAFSLHSVIGMVFLTIGLVGGLVLAIMLKSGLFILIVCIGGIEVWLEWYSRKHMKELKVIIDLHSTESLNNVLKLPEIKSIHDNLYKDEMPPMNRKLMIEYFLLYILTIMVLIGTMAMFKHIPGASLASELLK